MEKLIITLAGKRDDARYEKCRNALRWILSKDPAIVGIDKPLFEAEWNIYLKDMQRLLGEPCRSHKHSPLVLIGSSPPVYLGNDEAFLRWAKERFGYVDRTHLVYYKKRCKKGLALQTINNPSRAYCFIDFQLPDESPMTVIFELFVDVAPLTCKNFLELCKGTRNAEGVKIGYMDSCIHRVVPQAFVQGGSIVRGITHSIYHGEFPDESFAIKHDQIGLLGMARRGELFNTNECQFYVTLAAPLTFMDKRYVAFGRVVQGFRTFRVLEKAAVKSHSEEDVKCQVVDCGIYEYGRQKQEYKYEDDIVVLPAAKPEPAPKA